MLRLSVVGVAIAGVLIFLYGWMFSVVTLNEVTSFTINEGESLVSLSTRMEEENIITSSRALRLYLSFQGKDTKVQLGEYEFFGKLTLFDVATIITEEGPKYPLLTVTIPEGSTSLEVFQLFAKVLPQLNKDVFLNLVTANNSEGKLFPSTYHVLPSYKENSIITTMVTTYEKKTKDIILPNKIDGVLCNEKDVLILASILEGEANKEKDMQIVAGILLERMRIGMPLQVDVALETYKQKGLPEHPINNPGLIAIRAALNPITTEYLYYITGNDGAMYYAKTFNEHKRNIQKYLR